MVLLIKTTIVVRTDDDVTPDDVAQLFNDIPSDDRITIESVIPEVADVLDSD